MPARGSWCAAAGGRCGARACDDYVVPAFTNCTTNTWPIVLFSAVRFGLTPAVNALATIMLTITVLAVIVTAIVLRRSRVRAAPGQDQTGGLDIAVGLR
jgi:ABC-type spermidine/putrescine transport system permease subunit II